MALPLYGIDKEIWKSATNAYSQELRNSDELKQFKDSPINLTKEIINRKKTFFAAPTPENKQWLIEHGFLQVTKPVTTNESNVPTYPKKVIQIQISAEQKREYYAKIVSLEDQIQNLMNYIKSVMNNQVTKFDTPLENKLYSTYIRSGLSNEEAIQEMNNDIKSLNIDEQKKLLAFLNFH